MHDSKLEIILTAKDLSDKAFASAQSHVTHLDSSVSRLSLTLESMAAASVAAAGVAGFGAFVSVIADGTESLAEWDRKLLRTEALIKTTANAAGLQLTELSDFAKQLDLQTLGDRDEILDAVNAMQTFRSVSGDTFKRAITLGQDLAEVLGSDLRGQAIQLGKALEDPVKGLTALSRSGVSFTQVQKDQIKVLVESGQKLEAQSRILDEIEKQVGGAAVGAAGGLSGKMDTLSYRWREFKEAMANSVGGSKIAAAGIDTVSRSLEYMSSVLSPDVQTMMTKEIEGLQSRLKIFQRLGTDGSSKIIADVQSRIETLKSGLEELRNPVGDLSVDYGNLNDNIAAGQIIQENAAKAAREAAKAAEELAGEIRELDQVVRASNANPWDPIGYDVDRGGIDPVDAAAQKILQERNNQALQTARNIAVQAGIKDTYDIDMGDPMAGLEEDMNRVVELTQRTAYAMQENFSDFFFDIAERKFKDIGDYLDALTHSITRAGSDIAGQELTKWLFGVTATPHAKGGISSSPSLAMYEGLVTNKPHVFAFANGAGVFGEAGYEAIMPLKRTPSGKLGVEASGSARPVAVTIQLKNESGQDIQVEQPRIIQNSLDDIIATATIKRTMTSRTYRQATRV